MKTAFITGASQGLGREILAEFSRNGYFVIATSNRGKVELPGPGKVVPCDLSDAAAIKNAFAEIDRLDVLVNNARLDPSTRREGEDDASWFDRNIAVLKLFPGITPEVVNAILNAENLHGVIIETFGSGNAPTEKWFIDAMYNALKRGITVLNVTQCKAGSVVMCQYEASYEMNRIGIIGGNDITLEAAVTKMMYLLGSYPNNPEYVRKGLQLSMRGEMTVPC